MWHSRKAGPSPARETATLTVPQERIPVFIRAFEDAGAFDDQTHGVVTGHPVTKAFTYLPKPAKPVAASSST